MPRYIFKGPSVTLGRFGDVKIGDTLELTTREESYIRDDKRFVPFTDAQAKSTKPKLNLPANFDKLTEAEQKAATEQARAEEDARQEILRNANARTADENFQQMNMDELRGFAERLRAEGKTVTFRDSRGDTKSELIRAILVAQYGDPHAKDEPK